LQWSLLGAIGVSAVVLVLAGTRTAPGVSPDSVTYVAGARNLAAGRGYLTYSLREVTNWPPGLPLTLAAGDRLGIDPVRSARWGDALALAALAVLTFLIVRNHVVRPWLALWAAAGVAVAPPLLGVFTFVWSEPSFCVLALTHLLVCDLLIKRSRRLGALILIAGLLVGVAFAFRYAAVVLFPVGLLAILYASRGARARTVLARSLEYSGAALLVPSAVVGRNLWVGGGLLGPRYSSQDTVGGILDESLRTLSTWVDPHHWFPLELRYAVLAGVVVLVAVACVMARSDKARIGRRFDGQLLLLAFVGGYCTFLVLSGWSTSIGPIDDRFLSPVFAPAVALGAISLDAVLDRVPGAWERAVAPSVAALLVLGLGAALWLAADDARTIGATGQDFSAPFWRDSDLARRVRGLPPTTTVFSNFANALYYGGVHEPLYRSPAEHPALSSDVLNELPGFRQAVRASLHPVLAWYTAVSLPYLFTPQQLEEHGVKVVPLAVLRDGVIYGLG